MSVQVRKPDQTESVGRRTQKQATPRLEGEKGGAANPCKGGGRRLKKQTYKISQNPRRDPEPH